MNIRKTGLPALLALLWIGCKTSGGFDPIEIDFSKKASPSPTPRAATATPRMVTPTTTPTLTPTPTPTPPPAPVPASALSSTPAVPPARASVTPGPVSGEPATPLPRASFAGETPDLVTRKRIDAYNRRDLELLMSLYAPDAQIYDPPDRLRDTGAAQIRQTYTRRFSAAPDSKLEIRDVAVQGPYCVSRETEKAGAGEGSTALVISEVRDGRILRVWILR